MTATRRPTSFEARGRPDARAAARAGRALPGRAPAFMRKTGAPFFIDKMPNNCLYVGLIHLILPNAKIIDARRHPLGCCFSGFKQHFARGQSFTYDLEDLGRYYRDYVELMAHFDDGAAGPRASGVLRVDGRGHRGRGAPAAGATAGCRSRRRVCGSTRTSGPCAPRAPNRCASPFSGRRGAVAALRALARAAEEALGPSCTRLSGRAGTCDERFARPGCESADSTINTGSDP